MSAPNDLLRERFAASPLALLNDQSPSGALSVAELNKGLTQLSSNQRLALGCILLRHGHLEAAHEHANDVSGPYGDWLHAIMHRMEGDYGNCRYWCHRAGGDELYPAVAPDFSPAKLTAEVEALGRRFSGPEAEAAQALQHQELSVLFEHCCQP